MKNKNIKIMTVDLEHDLCSSNSTLGIDIFLPRILNLFDEKNIKATFFVVASLLNTHLKEILEIKSRGHEIASHSATHSFLNLENVKFEVESSRASFRKNGLNVKGFRAPGFVTIEEKEHLKLLKNAGYSYDASFARFFPGRFKRFGMPKNVFNTSCGLKELPMANMVWPSVQSGLSYLKLFHPLSKYFPKQYMFYLHLWEFLKKEDLLSILEGKKGIVEEVAMHNCGKKAWKIFVNFLNSEEEKGVKWLSCEKYLAIKSKETI